jgi:hypothetical protein
MRFDIKKGYVDTNPEPAGTVLYKKKGPDKNPALI